MSAICAQDMNFVRTMYDFFSAEKIQAESLETLQKALHALSAAPYDAYSIFREMRLQRLPKAFISARNLRLSAPSNRKVLEPSSADTRKKLWIKTKNCQKCIEYGKSNAMTP